MLPINDLNRHFLSLAAETEDAMLRVARSGWYVLGPEVMAFEKEFAEYCGVAHSIGVGNGTDALELALRAVGVERGDAVATVANAGMYATIAILAIGAIPVFVDVEPDRRTMSPVSLAEIREHAPLRAVVVTHLYGQLANIEDLIAAADGVPVIEDCAQAHGASRNSRRAGSFGAAGCFSFYPTKNLGAIGDGGAVVSDDTGIADRIRKLRQYGWREKYAADLPGGRNSRLDEMQAAILRVKLPRLDSWNERRRAVAAQYSQELAGLGLTLPHSTGDDFVAHLYVIESQDRDGLRGWLKNAGIGSDIHYPIPDHRQLAVLHRFGPNQSALPITEKLSETVLTLPCFPELTDPEILSVIRAIRSRH